MMFRDVSLDISYLWRICGLRMMSFLEISISCRHFEGHCMMSQSFFFLISEQLISVDWYLDGSFIVKSEWALSCLSSTVCLCSNMTEGCQDQGKVLNTECGVHKSQFGKWVQHENYFLSGKIKDRDANHIFETSTVVPFLTKTNVIRRERMPLDTPHWSSDARATALCRSVCIRQIPW